MDCQFEVECEPSRIELGGQEGALHLVILIPHSRTVSLSTDNPNPLHRAAQTHIETFWFGLTTL